ncbi:hypothetical protein THAOC_17700, partial [Thalassiosira oceanica]
TLRPMDTTNPAKRRKSACDPPRPGNDDPGTVACAELSLADLNRLIDQRVTDALEAVEAKNLALASRVDQGTEDLKAETIALSSRVDGLQRENEGLIRRCESLERSVQVLKGERNWTYSAPDVPRSHWLEQGYDEDYAEEAGKLIHSIEENTCGLRSSCDDDDDDVEVSCATLILSDDALDPHWEQLANAIQLSERITTVNFSDVQLDQRNLQIIEASLRQKGIVEFHLDSNQFRGGEGVRFAIDVLKSNRSVRCFGWEDNAFHSTENACELIDAVLEHPTLRRLELTRSFPNEDIAGLRRLFGGAGTDTLLNVELSFNGIKTNGDRCIPAFLSKNPLLERLILRGNRLANDDAHHIGLALKSNTNLRYLSLEGNDIPIEGRLAVYMLAVLGSSLSDPSDLNSLRKTTLIDVSVANHTCEIRGIFGSDDVTNVEDESEDWNTKNFMNNNSKSARWNRGGKLFWLLVARHRKGTNVSQLEPEFSEDGMGLVPHVLACISTCSTYWKRTDFTARWNLSVLFEVVRDWKGPEMYQFHQC